MSDEKPKKLREPEARVLALRIAASFPNREATTTQIKQNVPEYRELSDADLKKSATRPGEHLWEQIVGNATGSHKPTKVGIFERGLAIKTDDGIRVTDDGVEFLKKLGF